MPEGGFRPSWRAQNQRTVAPGVSTALFPVMPNLSPPHMDGHTHIHAQSVSYSVASTLCNPMDRSPLGSSVYGILQARILE